MATPKRQRIFMTGAPGYIGSRITEFAIHEGYEVHGLSRSASGTEKLRSLGAVPVSGSLSSLDVLRVEATQADIVIHLADSWADDFSQPYENVLKVDAAAVDAMIGGLRESKSTQKLFVGTSGTAVVEPDADDGETDETAPENSKPFNGRAKSEAYQLSKAGDGVRVCVMRLPGFVYGRGGSGVALFMGTFAKAGFVARVGDGKTQTCVVHVDDAARAYVLALKHARAKLDKTADIYNVTSSTEVTFRDMTDAIAATMGLSVKELSAAETAETVSPLIAAFFSHRNRAKSDKAMKELGWAPTEVGIVEDIRNGSYVQYAKKLKSTTDA